MTVHEGLEGVVACASAVSSGEGTTLTYRGYSIEELAAHATFEEVVYLLWHGHLPSRSALDGLRHDIGSQAALPADVVEIMRRLPTSVHPMEYLRTVTSLLAHYDPDRDDHSRAANLRKATRLVARLPAVVAGFDRIRHGQTPLAPLPDATLARQFLYLLHGQEPDPEVAACLETTLIVQADHELSAATFAARVTVATLSDMYSGVVSALGTLKGPLHGGANERVMRTLQAIGSVDQVEPYLAQALARKERMMGFGHRVYKAGDPRARILQPIARRMGDRAGQPHWYAMAVLLQECLERDRGLVPNVDFYAAPTYYTMHIPIDLFTPVFALARVAGWTAHIMEQLQRNRLIRPRAHYVGPASRPWQPLETR